MMVLGNLRDMNQVLFIEKWKCPSFPKDLCDVKAVNIYVK